MNWDRLRSHDDAVQGHLADGDYRRALETLVQAYQHAIVGFCHNMLGDVTQAEEVAQEIFLDAYKAMPRFRQQASVRTWLFAIARKKCLQVRRNRDRRQRIVQEKQGFIAQGAHRDAPATPGEDPEALFQLVKQGLTQLSEEEGSLLSMRYDTGLSVADIAPILGMSTASVRRRLAHALGRLREVIDGET
jgi:RNA polymerase sigma-70 factor (ECF subfamily)